MFRKSLGDLVRGIRSNKKQESKYISECIQEIKDELKQPDMTIKCVAIQKLNYLQMLGYDMNWASFNVVEVMSYSKFSIKRSGYLAASQSFRDSTEVIMLTTQLIRKDMGSSNVYEAGLALNCLANICTPDLALDLAESVVGLLSTSRPYVRKRAVLALYKVFLKYPEALRLSFQRLKEKLEDPDITVVSCAVNVICELARKNPRNYLPLAPLFYKLLTTSNHNWMLIKIIKLFASLTPLEKRLSKKLADPLTHILNTTPAMSLLYETIQTCIIGLAENADVMRLCITKLRAFIEDPDQNLKYLGLLALYNIMKIHPKAVSEYRELVIWCLDDEDVTIRLRALDLLAGMATKKNMMDVVQKLMERLERADGIYRDDLIAKIIEICSQASTGQLYQFVTNFEWYVTILIDLAHVQGTIHGKLIASQLLDVAVRVKIVRPFMVKSMLSVLQDQKILDDHPDSSTSHEVLNSAAWILGEFISQMEDTTGVMEALFQPRVLALTPNVQSSFLQAALKVFIHKASLAAGSQQTADPANSLESLIPFMKTRLESFRTSNNIEVQERACFLYELLNLYGNLKASGIDISADLSALGDQVLNPVAPKAQKKVPVPEGLDLDAQINEIPPEQDSDDEKNSYAGAPLFDQKQEEFVEKETEEEREEKRKQRLRDRQNNPYFLTDEPPNYHFKEDLPSIQDITNDRHFGVSKNSGYQQAQAAFVNMAMEAPEGANLSSDSEDESKKKRDPLADIDLHSELKPGESLFRREHHVVQLPAKQKKERSKKEKKKREKKDKEGKKNKKDGKDKREKEKREKKDKKGKGRKETAGRGQNSLIDFNDMFGAPTTSPSPVASSTSAPTHLPSPSPSPSFGSASSQLSSHSSQPHISSVPFQSTPTHSSNSHNTSQPAAHYHPSPVDVQSTSGHTPLLGQHTPINANIPRTSSLGSHDPMGFADTKKLKKDKKSKKEKKVKDSKSQRKSSHPVSNGSSQQSLLNLQSVPSFTLLAKDPSISLFYLVNVNEKEVNKAVVTLSINNTSTSALTSVQLKVQGTLNLQLINPPAVDTVPAMQSKMHQLVFTVNQITIPQRISATISYTTTGGKSQSLDFHMPFPCSVFILPVKINFDQLSKLLTGEAGVSFFQASESVDLSNNQNGLDPRSALALLSSSLHLEIVEAVAAAASLYGRSVQGHHVAALVKQKSASSISLDFKCSDGNLAASLAKEAAILLRR